MDASVPNPRLVDPSRGNQGKERDKRTRWCIVREDRNQPGALSRWYEFYYDVVKEGQFTLQIQKLHDKYGHSSYLIR
jgi:hypothetical protein